jgi:hypothetical protein
MRKMNCYFRRLCLFVAWRRNGSSRNQHLAGFGLFQVADRSFALILSMAAAHASLLNTLQRRLCRLRGSSFCFRGDSCCLSSGFRFVRGLSCRGLLLFRSRFRRFDLRLERLQQFHLFLRFVLQLRCYGLFLLSILDRAIGCCLSIGGGFFRCIGNALLLLLTGLLLSFLGSNFRFGCSPFDFLRFGNQFHNLSSLFVDRCATFRECFLCFGGSLLSLLQRGNHSVRGFAFVDQSDLLFLCDNPGLFGGFAGNGCFASGFYGDFLCSFGGFF